jgi:hypothetical protein
MSLGDFLWSLLVIYFMLFYFMMLFRVIGDLFRDPDVGGVAKTGWVIFLIVLPFLSLFIYLITRGKAMSERAMAQAQEMNEAQQAYIRQVAGSSDEPAARIARAHELLDAGTISPAEYETLKAKALA